jgi:hypothetical protein
MNERFVNFNKHVFWSPRHSISTVAFGPRLIKHYTYIFKTQRDLDGPKMVIITETL